MKGRKRGGTSTESQAHNDDPQEQRATTIARWVAVVVLIVGTAIVLVPALVHIGAVFKDDPFKPRQTVATVTTEKDGVKSTQTTTKEADQSFVERSLEAGGLLLLRFGVIALAAFLAGAVVQRTLLGDFALKVGPVEIPELKRAASASKDAVEKVVARINKQEKRLADAMLATATTSEGTANIEERLSGLEQLLAGLVGEEEPGGKQKPAKETNLDVSVHLENDKKPEGEDN